MSGDGWMDAVDNTELSMRPVRCLLCLDTGIFMHFFSGCYRRSLAKQLPIEEPKKGLITLMLGMNCLLSPQAKWCPLLFIVGLQL